MDSLTEISVRFIIFSLFVVLLSGCVSTKAPRQPDDVLIFSALYDDSIPHFLPSENPDWDKHQQFFYNATIEQKIQYFGYIERINLITADAVCGPEYQQILTELTQLNPVDIIGHFGLYSCAQQEGAGLAGVSHYKTLQKVLVEELRENDGTSLENAIRVKNLYEVTSILQIMELSPFSVRLVEAYGGFYYKVHAVDQSLRQYKVRYFTADDWMRQLYKTDDHYQASGEQIQAAIRFELAGSKLPSVMLKTVREQIFSRDLNKAKATLAELPKDYPLASVIAAEIALLERQPFTEEERKALDDLSKSGFVPATAVLLVEQLLKPAIDEAAVEPLFEQLRYLQVEEMAEETMVYKLYHFRHMPEFKSALFYWLGRKDLDKALLAKALIEMEEFARLIPVDNSIGETEIWQITVDGLASLGGQYVAVAGLARYNETLVNTEATEKDQLNALIKASDMGSEQAMALLGDVYLKGSYEQAVDHAKGLALYEQALAKNDKYLLDVLQLYFDKQYDFYNEEKAQSMLDDAIASGNKDAMCFRSYILDYQQDGNEVTATELMNETGETDTAICDLARGELAYAIERDYATAAFWFRQASKKQNSSAYARLGSMYLKGEGVPKNIDTARALLERVVIQGGYITGLPSLLALYDETGDMEDLQKGIALIERFDL